MFATKCIDCGRLSSFSSKSPPRLPWKQTLESSQSSLKCWPCQHPKNYFLYQRSHHRPTRLSSARGSSGSRRGNITYFYSRFQVWRLCHSLTLQICDRLGTIPLPTHSFVQAQEKTWENCLPFLKDLFRYCWLKRPQEKRSTPTMRHSPLLEHLWSLSVFGLPWRVISASVSLDSVGQAKRQSDQSIEALQTQVRPYLGKLHSPSRHFVLAYSQQRITKRGKQGTLNPQITSTSWRIQIEITVCTVCDVFHWMSSGGFWSLTSMDLLGRPKFLNFCCFNKSTAK